MPRPKKIISKKPKKELEQEEVIDLTPEEAGAPAVGRKITVEKKVYSRPLTIEEADRVESGDEDPVEEAFEDLDTIGADEISNDLLNFFDADSGDEQHRLRVFQMLKPSKNTAFAKGNTIFRGEIPYTGTFLRDVQETFGGGVFRLQVCGDRIDETTGRTRFGILKSKTVTISAPSMPRIDATDPNSQQHLNGSTYPQVPYLLQQPQSVEQIPPKTTKEELKDIVEIITMVDKIRGPREESPPAAPAAATDPEAAAWQLLSKNSHVMDHLRNGIASAVLGAKAGDSDPWADVAMEAIKSGQAADIAATIIREIMAPFQNLRGTNGQAQYAPPQAPPPGVSPPAAGVIFNNRVQPVPTDRNKEAVAATQAVILTPADALIVQLTQACERNAPLKEAQNIINVACYRTPELSESIDELLNMSQEEIMNMLSAWNPKVSEIPHAREWFEKLIGSLSQSGEKDQ